MNDYDLIIVGGGLAGLTAALHIAREGYTVLVIEKQQYPHHKVCGEYVSNEILDYLDHLGVSLTQAKAVSIDTLELSTIAGKSLRAKLPLGGKGISRYALDRLLYQRALFLQVNFVFGSATAVGYNNNLFTVTTDTGRIFTAPIVIGAYGKRANLDHHLNRNFIGRKSPWLGVKAHYRHDGFPENLVALHNFRGGYGGLSKTETGAVNFCYLVSYNSFKREKDIESFNANVVRRNPLLGAFLEEARPLFERPLSIAQISFSTKKAVENHVLMCGDTAGLIHPLCGNGMAMAIHSAKIAAELICRYFKDKHYDRAVMEADYTRKWNRTFRGRLQMGRLLQSVLLNHTLSDLSMGSVANSPWLLKGLIRKTHGNPVVV